MIKLKNSIVTLNKYPYSKGRATTKIYNNT